MPPLGRPPAERNVHGFEGVLVPPDELVLDTSFVVDALIPSQGRHAECRDFLALIADAGSTVAFNTYLEIELWEATYKIALNELRPQGDARQARSDGRARRRANRIRRETEDAWRNVRDALDWFSVDVGEVGPWIPEQMNLGLSAYDAIHAATCTYADIPALVTLDYHFAAAPDLELWVPTSRVRPCRERRGRRRPR